MTANFLGVKGLYPTLIPGGRSVTKIPFTQSKSACNKPFSASGPLCWHSCPLGPSASTANLCLPSRPAQPSSGPLSLVLPLLCSPAALQPCHRVKPRALGGALYVESIAMYCPHVHSELVNQGQVRILELSFYPQGVFCKRFLGTQE